MPELLFPEPPLSACGLRLRPFIEGDIPIIAATFRDSDTARFMPNLVRDYTEADASDWLESHEPARMAGEGLAFAVADAGSDELLGCVSVQTDLVHGTAVLAYWLRPMARGMGHMTTAVRLVTEWLFMSLEIGRVDDDRSAKHRIASRR